MASPIRFNPSLGLQKGEQCVAYERPQRNLLLSFLSYLGAPLTGRGVGQRTHARIEASLEHLEPWIGPWQVVWGPGIFQVVPGAVAANTMFVAEHRETGELFVSVAGTNPFSAYAWFVEDFRVAETRPWRLGDAPEDAAISEGTLRGLLALRGMVPPPGLPGANTSFERFLADRFSGEGDAVELTVGGHSLGGALSPALGLRLRDTAKSWDLHGRASVSVYAYAGPTPGNAAFASYIDSRFGGRLHRIANRLDVVPHVWNVADIADLKALYSPQLRRDALWDTAADAAIAATNGNQYRQIDSEPTLLDGQVKEDLVWAWAPSILNHASQVLYQHTVAYFELLGMDYPEQEEAVGRHVAGETRALVREIVSRSGAGVLLAHTLAAAAWVLAEGYARLSSWGGGRR